jgi:hypothetical protein
MNNTNTLAIVAVFMAATLVVGTFATVAITTQSAFAAAQKKPPGHADTKTRDNGSGNGNGNTVTIEECKNRNSASGFDTVLDQECENLICTHPGNNATCTQEGAAAASAAVAAAKRTCEQCFTKLLTAQQIAFVVGGSSLPFLCNELKQGIVSEDDLRFALGEARVSTTTANELIACLLQAGVVLQVE